MARTKLPKDTVNTPETRGKRLRQLRQMSGLTRQAIETRYDISARTTRSWEEGSAGGLTSKGAMRVVYAMSETKIHVTKEWLLYGGGIGPQWMDGDPLNNTNKSNLMLLDLDDESAIRTELLAFRQHNHNPIDLRVTDDGMAPHYMAGDYIGGKQRFDQAIAHCINRDCIVETANGELLFRRLKAGSKTNLYTLFCINTDTITHEPVLYDVKLKSAAPIIWHRRPDK